MRTLSSLFGRIDWRSFLLAILVCCSFFLQLVAELEGFAVCDLIHQRPEAVAVVQLDGVAKLVEQDVVDQMPGESHQEEGEVDVLPVAAATPATVHILDGDTVVMKPMLTSQRLQTGGQAALGLVPEGGLEQAAQGLLGSFFLEAGLLRAADQ